MIIAGRPSRGWRSTRPPPVADHYISLFVGLDHTRDVFATEGKDAETTAVFADDLTAHGGDPDAVAEVCIDMSPAHIKGTADSLPNAIITFDKFHAVKIINDLKTARAYRIQFAFQDFMSSPPPRPKQPSSGDGISGRPTVGCRRSSTPPARSSVTRMAFYAGSIARSPLV